MQETVRFKLIKELKPLIEGDSGLVSAIDACFDNYHNQKDLPDNIQADGSGKTRAVYTGLPLLADSEYNELYFALKIGSRNSYPLINKRDHFVCPNLSNEFAALEEHSPPEGPKVMMAVYSEKYNSIALLTEDYTCGGKYKLEHLTEHPAGVQENDFVNVLLPEGKVCKIADGKHKNPKDPEVGKPYLRKDSVVFLKKA